MRGVPAKRKPFCGGRWVFLYSWVLEPASSQRPGSREAVMYRCVRACARASCSKKSKHIIQSYPKRYERCSGQYPLGRFIYKRAPCTCMYIAINFLGGGGACQVAVWVPTSSFGTTILEFGVISRDGHFISRDARAISRDELHLQR